MRRRWWRFCGARRAEEIAWSGDDLRELGAANFRVGSASTGTSKRTVARGAGAKEETELMSGRRFLARAASGVSRAEAEERLFLVVPNELDTLALSADVGERLSGEARILLVVGEQRPLESVDVAERSFPMARFGGVRTLSEDQSSDEVNLDSGGNAIGVVDDSAEGDVLGERDMGEELAEDDASVLRDGRLGELEKLGEVRNERVQIVGADELLGGVGEESGGENAGAEEVAHDDEDGVQVAVFFRIRIARILGTRIRVLTVAHGGH